MNEPITVEDLLTAAAMAAHPNASPDAVRRYVQTGLALGRAEGDAAISYAYTEWCMAREIVTADDEPAPEEPHNHPGGKR